jgi:glycerol dehydrogenase-like iron-containing ADH family enzyme
VGFFTPLFLNLNGYENWEEVRNYLLNLGFPESLKMSRSFAERVFSIASQTRPHRYTVLEEMGWEEVLRRAIELEFITII